MGFKEAFLYRKFMIFYVRKLSKINRQDYYNDIKQAAFASREIAEGSHGLRWNFAKRRMFECGKADYTYSDSLQEVSYEMKHNRASITEHYLRGRFLFSLKKFLIL